MKKMIALLLLAALFIPGPALAEPAEPLTGDISREEALKIAGEAIAFKWGPEPDLLDEGKWRQHLYFQAIRESPQLSRRQWQIWFEPRDVRLNEYSLDIRHDGQVLDARMRPGTENPTITPSQVQDSYSLVHGPMQGWDHGVWAAFQRDLKRAAEWRGTDAMPGNLGLFLVQEFGEPDEGMIPRQEAVAIAGRLPEAPEDFDLAGSGAVLLMDHDTPVWKVQLMPPASSERRAPFLAEIDARTGEVRGFRQVAADDYRYRLNFVLDRLVPQTTEAPLPQATPRPDGKPPFWYSPKAPDYYWEAMDRLREPDKAGELLRQWEAEYGSNTLFWPLEAQAFYHTIDNLDALEGTFPGLPDEEDISRECALEIARQAVLDAGMSREELDRLTPAFRFYFNETVPSGHEWAVDFVLIEGVEARYITGVSIDAKSGEVIGVGGNG